MFRLTRQEQQLVIFLLTAFLLGLVVKHYRHADADHSPAPLSPAALQQQP